MSIPAAVLFAALIENTNNASQVAVGWHENSSTKKCVTLQCCMCSQSRERDYSWRITGGFTGGKCKVLRLLDVPYDVLISEWIPLLVSRVKAKYLQPPMLTSATLIHFSSSRALCWLRSFVGQRQDARTALANLLNWRTVARTDQQTPSRPFLSLWDHSEPRQWYGTRRTNSSWGSSRHI